MKPVSRRAVQPESLKGPAQWQVPSSRAVMLAEAKSITIASRLESYGPDVAGLQELILYGLKGTAAYADHAAVLGVEDAMTCTRSSMRHSIS